MFMLFCMFGWIAGCGNQNNPPPTLEQVKAYEAQEAMTIRSSGYQPTVLQRKCIDGVEYYAGHSGHAMYLTPVVDKTTLLFKPCGMP